MVNLKTVFGTLGNIIAICLFMSPGPTFWGIYKKKSVQDYSGIPYVCTLMNCMLWVAYGLPIIKFQLLVVTINGAGCIIELTYVALYLIYAPKKLKVKMLRLMVLLLVSFTFVMVMVLTFTHDKSRRKLVIGSLCAVFNVGMCGSPLTVMGMVIRTRSVEYMPFLLSLFNFLNALAWFGFAFVGGVDIFIAIPNGLGILLSIAQLSLYTFYKNATPVGETTKKDQKGKAMKPVSHTVYVGQADKNSDKETSAPPKESELLASLGASLPKHTGDLER